MTVLMSCRRPAENRAALRLDIALTTLLERVPWRVASDLERPAAHSLIRVYKVSHMLHASQKGPHSR
jgi:hypothetical protein